MEPIFQEKNRVAGVEVLRFEHAELEKIKGSDRIFAAIGPLSVLYFKDYNRFVLQLNDWKYPLLRRLPIMGAHKMNVQERLLHLPALNGFHFDLKIMNIHSSEALLNLEAILRENAGFYYKGEEIAFRKMDASPDDKLMRMKPQGMMDKMGEKMDMMGKEIKMGMDKMKNMKISGKEMKIQGMDSRKRVMIKDIKRRNFKREAHASFKKDWFESHEKMTKDIHVMRKHNFANFKPRNIDEIRHADHLPLMYLNREDVEESILRNKDMASIGKFNLSHDMPKKEEKKGLMSQIKEGLHDMKEAITGRVNKADIPMEQNKIDLDHYQG